MISVNFSTNLSIIIQLLTGIIGLNGLFVNLSENNKILQQVLTLEMIVQFVELFFYIFVLQSMAITALPQMAAMRYVDWIITTPTMLLTTIIFYKYEEHLENNIDKKLEFIDFLKTHRDNIITIILCNFLMLFFGYLGEIGAIDIKLSLTLGFLFFGITFYIIYKNYAVKSKNATKLFYYVVTVWGLYGVAALMSPYTKNNMFNILDIFAKNFFGLYLYYRIKKISTSQVKN
jgi:bacteriorhodopsin